MERHLCLIGRALPRHHRPKTSGSDPSALSNEARTLRLMREWTPSARWDQAASGDARHGTVRAPSVKPYAARPNPTDGSIWYTGQLGNVLGRVDPKTGQVKDYPLKISGFDTFVVTLRYQLYGQVFRSQTILMPVGSVLVVLKVVVPIPPVCVKV